MSRMNKRCFKCGEIKSVNEFYTHSQTADGRLGKCKECTRKDVKNNRDKNRDYYLIYDRKRYDEHGVRGDSAPDPDRGRKYRDKYPERYKANEAVTMALRSGKLVKGPCELCGSRENIHAHHDDYSEMLEVRWLCASCHGSTRKKSRDL